MRRIELFPLSILSLFVGAWLFVACNSCGAQQPTSADVERAQHAAVAGAIASGANAALPVLAEAMEREEMLEIEKADSRAEAERAIGKVEARWAPVWEAWRLLVIAQDGYATAIEAKEDAAAHLANMKARYCELRALWPTRIPAVPLGLVACPAIVPVTDAGAEGDAR